MDSSLVFLHCRGGATELYINLKIEVGDRSFHLHKVQYPQPRVFVHEYCASSPLINSAFSQYVWFTDDDVVV